MRVGIPLPQLSDYAKVAWDKAKQHTAHALEVAADKLRGDKHHD